MSETIGKKRSLEEDQNKPTKICRIDSLHVETEVPNLLSYLDVLPYVDPSYGVENMPLEQQVTSLIKSEMTTTPFKLENYLPLIGDFHFPDFKGTAFLENEFKKIASGTKTSEKGVDNTKYEVSAPSTNKKNDINAWKAALSNAKSQYQSLLLRLENLELQQTYGSNAWIQYNSKLESLQKSIKLSLDSVKSQIDELNKQRASAQVNAGKQIKVMEDKWKELIFKNFELSKECNVLKDEISALKAAQQKNVSKK